jgi:cyclopropane fatty-acyl-phospholipid synthase-like methyltransferase
VEAATHIDAILVAWKSGRLSTPIALMELLLLVKDASGVASAVEDRAARETSDTYRELLRVLAANREGAERVVCIARTLERQARESGNDAIRSTAVLFDEVVGQSEEASVALYSLGSPDILAEATAEVVTLLETWRCLDGSKEVLDIGCGIGRFEEALAPRVASIHGVDVSMAMVEAARRRTAGISNVRLDVTSGRDLSIMKDDSFDLVLAIDSMPYIVEAGVETVDAMFREIARVLRPDGELVICGFSYRADVERDRADIRRQSDAHQMSILAGGKSYFELWDGRVFRLRAKPPSTGASV